MKLSDEEQKEKQLENYKMLSALTGMNINELMYDEIQNHYPENDCKSKEIILKNCVDPITSRELWNLIQRQGYKGKYKTFTSLLVQYQKAGFIEKSNTKPTEYKLTEFGVQNAKSPKMLREQCIKRYHEFQNKKLTKIINENPELVKSIYESIHGTQNSIINTVVPAGTAGNQFSNNDLGSSEELKQELNNKIFSSDFWKDTDANKLRSLVDEILDHSLSDKEKQELIMDALMEAVNSHKGSIILQREYNPSKTIGLRNYYPTIINAIDKSVTESVYQEIPFRFIYISKKNELRLESEAIAGKYRNNQDAMFIDFDLVNQRYFYNKMQIKTRNNGKELEFYYAVVDGKGVWGFNRKITTMSFADYNKELKKSEKQSVKINVQKD